MQSTEPGRRLDHVVVVGANGVMGYGAGALFARAGTKVTFLARSSAKAEEGLAAAIKQAGCETLPAFAETGSYMQDLETVVAGADLVIEALAEDFSLKDGMFARVAAARQENCIVGTVTSGLSINNLCANRDASFRRHFLGLHLFNPPSALTGTELIAARDTDPAVVDYIEALCREQLGREVIRTADTPGFAANRIGVKIMNEAARLAADYGPALVDRLLGPHTGQPMGLLSIIDYVGWDIHRAISENLYANTADEAHASLKPPTYMAPLMARGVLGMKSGRGFFKREGRARLVLDPASGAYAPLDIIALPDKDLVAEMTSLHDQGRHDDAMALLSQADGAAAALTRGLLASYISYAYHRVGEVTRTIDEIDTIMRSGFIWAPPSLLVDLFGVARTADMIEAAGLLVPPALAAAKREGRDLPFDRASVNVAKLFGVRSAH